MSVLGSSSSDRQTVRGWRDWRRGERGAGAAPAAMGMRQVGRPPDSHLGTAPGFCSDGLAEEQSEDLELPPPVQTLLGALEATGAEGGRFLHSGCRSAPGSVDGRPFSVNICKGLHSSKPS